MGQVKFGTVFFMSPHVPFWSRENIGLSGISGRYTSICAFPLSISHAESIFSFNVENDADDDDNKKGIQKSTCMKSYNCTKCFIDLEAHPLFISKAENGQFS